MKLRDRFWLWGHPEGCFNKGEFGWNFQGVSRMTPTEACFFLGISKTFMVPMTIEVNRRQYNKSFTPLKEVGWECFGADVHPEKIDQILTEAKEFPNIKAAVFDDFVGKAKKRREAGEEVTPDALYAIRDRLNNNDVRSLPMWMVLYTREFGLDKAEDENTAKFLAPFNGIIMWTWEEKDVPLIPEKFETLKKLTPGQRRMFGCYLYNFGERKEATAAAVKWQLDFYRAKILAGEAEGVVLHTNTMADMDFEAYTACLEWMAEHGDEEIGEPIYTV